MPFHREKGNIIRDWYDFDILIAVSSNFQLNMEKIPYTGNNTKKIIETTVGKKSSQ